MNIMKRELNEQELNEVSGGAVILSAPMGLCGFNTLGEMYKIKGDFKTMRNRLLDLYDAHEDMPDRDFDILVRNEFKAKGWI